MMIASTFVTQHFQLTCRHTTLSLPMQCATPLAMQTPLQRHCNGQFSLRTWSLLCTVTGPMVTEMYAPRPDEMR